MVVDRDGIASDPGMLNRTLAFSVSLPGVCPALLLFLGEREREREKMKLTVWLDTEWTWSSLRILNRHRLSILLFILN